MNRIKEILKERGITINELADKLGISRVTLSTQIMVLQTLYLTKK